MFEVVSLRQNFSSAIQLILHFALLHYNLTFYKSIFVITFLLKNLLYIIKISFACIM